MPQADSFLQLTVRFRRRNAQWLRSLFMPIAASLGQRQMGDGSVTIRTLSKVGALLTGVTSGIYSGNVWMAVQEGPGGVLPATYPTGSITCTFANAANDTVTFTWGGATVVLTESSTLTGLGYFSRGTTDATLATNLGACINKHPVLGGIFNATVATNVVTLTGKLPGATSRNTGLSTSDGTAFALVQVTGGNEGGAPFFPTQVWVNRSK
jgi:hypothetical protein